MTPSEPITEGTRLWEPSVDLKRRANITAYIEWLKNKRDLDFSDYNELWRWSVDRPDEFWASLWHFFEIQSASGYRTVLTGKMPTARWFEGARLNYAEHVFRNRSDNRPALLFQSERHPLAEISWEDLEQQVAGVAGALRGWGVAKGDRVAAFLPNIPQTVVAFLAAASIGAVWSSCSPDFGTRSVIDRIRQIEPKVFFTVDGYQYGGRSFDCLRAAAAIASAIPSLEKTVIVPYLEPQTELDPDSPMAGAVPWDEAVATEGDLAFEPLPYSHPIWIVYSSGTTGLPKGLVHSQGGILIEFLKFLGLHMDLHPGDRFFWYSTTGWVMWNIVQGSLLLGATPVLYDGSPGWPDMQVLWDLAEQSRMTVFGTSAAFLHACMGADLSPGESRDLSQLKTVGSTGSPLSPEGFDWVYRNVKEDIWLASVSGGTDPCSGFLVSCPLLPVHAGHLQCRALGADVDAFDDAGESLVDSVGELVIKKPMPSMPIYLWNDAEYRRYYESYFELYPGVWRHGDWIRITPAGGAVILGRSDSTLKRQGIRIGTSEIYSALEELSEISDSLIVGFDISGEYRMPLFVVLEPGQVLDTALEEKIKQTIRRRLTPRHLPDRIIAVPDIPRTLNGKKMEVPVKKIFMGIPVAAAVNLDSMSNPEIMDTFLELRGRV